MTMELVLCFLLFSVYNALGFIQCHNGRLNKIMNRLRMSDELKDSPAEEIQESARDLEGYKLWLTFNGFNVKDMSTGVTLDRAYRSEFVNGLSR